MCASSWVRPRHAREAVHHARLLVAVDGAELEHAQRELAVRAHPALVDQDVERAVHRLEVVLGAAVELHRREHAVGEPVEVARRLEQVRLRDVRRVHELVAGGVVPRGASSPPSRGGSCRPSGGTRRARSRSRRETRRGRARHRACGGRASPPPRVGAGAPRAPPSTPTPCRRCAGASGASRRRASTRRRPW